MKIYRSREGAITDDDVKTQLTTLGSQTAPGPLQVPAKATHLRAIHVAGVSSNEAAAAYAFLVRLEGPGIERGNFVMAAGAGGGAVATGGSTLVPSTRLPVNIPVTPGQEVLIFAEALGADMGTYQMGVTLEFSDSLGDSQAIKGEVTVEGDLTAVDTLTRFTSQGSVAAPSRLTPPTAAKLSRIVYAISHDCAADGEANFLLRIGGDAILGGEQIIVLGAGAFVDVQAGSDAGHVVMSPTMLEELDLDIVGNETIDISLEMTGIDVGTVTGVISCIFE